MILDCERYGLIFYLISKIWRHSCRHTVLGLADCDHSQDVAVSCIGMCLSLDSGKESKMFCNIFS